MRSESLLSFVVSRFNDRIHFYNGIIHWLMVILPRFRIFECFDFANKFHQLGVDEGRDAVQKADDSVSQRRENASLKIEKLYEKIWN